MTIGSIMRFALSLGMPAQKGSGMRMAPDPRFCGPTRAPLRGTLLPYFLGILAATALPVNASAATPPIITTVSPILPQQFQTITITGSGFGTLYVHKGIQE